MPNQASVMIVGSESDDRNYKVSALESHGYNVEVVPTGKDALKWLRAQRDHFEMVVSYFHLPDMSSIDLVTDIREIEELSSRPIGVILLVPSDRDDAMVKQDIYDGYQAGVDMILDYPGNAEELPDYCRRIITSNRRA